MTWLLVEDDDPKREHVLSFLHSTYANVEIKIARSVRSAVESLQNNAPKLVLLDISLDTFDRGQNESGGRPQGFGGTEILRYMDILDIQSPVIVITGYEAFSRDGQAIDHTDLSRELFSNHPNTYIGLVYYNAVYGGWHDKLKELINKVVSA